MTTIRTAVRTAAHTAALALVALVIAAGVLLAVPSQAQAAGNANPDLYFCLTYANGTPYNNSLNAKGQRVASGPVYLYQHNGTKWVQIRSGKTNAAGCGTWVDVPPNGSYYIQGYWNYRVGSAVYAWHGNTQAGRIGAVGSGTWGTFTGTVANYRIA